MSDIIVNLLPLSPEERTQFETIAPEATHIYARRSTVTPEALSQATVILGWPRVDDLHLAPNLRWLHAMWAGVDEYVGKVAFPQGCRVTGSAGTNAQSVSEHMLACLLALCHRIPEASEGQLRRQWVTIGDYKTIQDATILVVGAGNIGRRFGKLCQGMGGHTVGLQRTPCAQLEGFHEVHTMDRLDELLPTADVVALCLPQTPATDHIMDSRRFPLMKEGAIFLNAGRGNAVEQPALIAALEGGGLWGAALDVTDPEPLPAEHPLWTAPNLLLTPHCAGGLRLAVTRDNIVALAQDNLRRYLAGEPLLNLAEM